MAVIVTSVKGVASPSWPPREPTLLSRHSIKWAMVIREGMAWGLMMRSGTMPSAVKGQSSVRYVTPIVP